MMPRSEVAEWYLMTILTADAWDCLGLEVNQATWLTAKAISGLCLSREKVTFQPQMNTSSFP